MPSISDEDKTNVLQITIPIHIDRMIKIEIKSFHSLTEYQNDVNIQRQEKLVLHRI